MQRKIAKEVLLQHRLMVASPHYGGMCHSIFARSLADLMALSGYWQLPVDIAFLSSESLITRARNVLADQFLRSPADHLMFIDADIGFDANDVLELLILQIQNANYEIIGGRYRLKRPGGTWVFNSTVIVDEGANEPQLVDGIGTGFMMIHRRVFERFKAKFPQLMYTPDYGANPWGDSDNAYGGDRRIVQFFQAEIDPDTNRYLSEDYWFSKRCMEIGIKTWLCSWMKLRHAGGHIFE